MSVEFDEVARGVYRVHDTCTVYLVTVDREHNQTLPRTAIAIDFGSGLVLDVAASLGITVTDVLMTHHHRDQGQGLPLAVDRGIRIHVPPVEVDLFGAVDELWLTRQFANDFTVRQDRFSLLASVEVESTMPEYRTVDLGGVTIRTVPTPGHTVGSVTYLVDRDGARLAFSGDLIYAPAKVWSLAATQWSYSNQEGAAMTVLSCYLLADEDPDVLLPSHGDVMKDGRSALLQLATAMQDYVDSRRAEPWDLLDRLRNPWVALSPHLLLNRSSVSCTYAVLSEGGEALLVDYGYDMTTGILPTSERSARRPWLASLPALKSGFGVTKISVALPTHYHDDHVGGLPLLREVEGTALWIPSTVASVLSDPLVHDLPCQWYEAIIADVILTEGVPFEWNEYRITAHRQPGHTLFAVAYEVEIDGVTVVFTGDQQEGLGVVGGRREFLNYQYRNRFALGDYAQSAALYQSLDPALLASGHWKPRWVDDGYLGLLAEEGDAVDELHRRLLPLDEYGIAVDGVVARISPYRSEAAPGSILRFVVEVTNPIGESADASVTIVIPNGWSVSPSASQQRMFSGQTVEFVFDVTTGIVPIRRARIAADVTVGSLRLGQHAEAIVTVSAP